MAKKIYLKKKERDNIARFIQSVEAEGIKVIKIILFGSRTKGTAKPDSDIDIAIVSNQFKSNDASQLMKLRRIAVKIDSALEPIPMTPSDLIDKYSTLSQEIRKYGCEI